jgi:hypothetical protein
MSANERVTDIHRTPLTEHKNERGSWRSLDLSGDRNVPEK